MSDNYICKPIYNPIRSLEPKHILFYYLTDRLPLERSKDKQGVDKKKKMLGNNTIKS